LDDRLVPFDNPSQELSFHFGDHLVLRSRAHIEMDEVDVLGRERNPLIRDFRENVIERQDAVTFVASACT